MRRSNTYLTCLLALFIGLIATLIDAGFSQRYSEARMARSRALVGQLGLSDLALFTEARYTRHPSQADLHSAFQDHPGGVDHFPSGSLILPPQSLAQ
jgi:hypothetical protein